MSAVITHRAVFANLLVGRLQFRHGSAESREVSRAQRVVVIVQILAVEAIQTRNLS